MTHYPLEKNISGVVFIGNKGSKLLSTENNFVYDSGNNRLGINVTNPQYTLDVSGTGNFIAIRFSDGSTQTTAGGGGSYDFNLAVGNETSTVISSGETISFSGVGNNSVSRSGNYIFISGAGSVGGGVTGPANTVSFFSGNGALTGSSTLTYDPVKTSFTLTTQGDTPSTGFVILNNQNQSGNVFQIRSFIRNVNSNTYNNQYTSTTGDGSYTSNAGFQNNTQTIEFIYGTGTFATGFLPFSITGYLSGSTVINDDAYITVYNANSLLSGTIVGSLALFTGNANPLPPANTGDLASQVTQLSEFYSFSITGTGSTSTLSQEIDISPVLSRYFEAYPTNTGNILFYYLVSSTTGSIVQNSIGSASNPDTGLTPKLNISFTTYQYAGTNTNKPIYSVDHVGRIKIGNIERSDQLINSFLLYASGEPNQQANVQIESPNSNARVLFTKNNAPLYSFGTVGSDGRLVIRDENKLTTPVQIFSQVENQGVITIRNGNLGVKTNTPGYPLVVGGGAWIRTVKLTNYTNVNQVPETTMTLYALNNSLYWNGSLVTSGGPGGAYTWTVRDGSGNLETVADAMTVYWSGAGNVSTLYTPATNVMRISGSPGWNLGVGNESTSGVTNNSNITFTGLGNVTVTRNGGQISISGSSVASSGGNSYDWKLSANSGATTTITSGTTVNFTGLGSITVTRNGSEIRISGAPSSGSGGGTPGGSNTQIQYNSSGSFAGDSSLVWNYGTKALSVSGTSTVNSINTGVVFQVKNTGSSTIFSVSDVSETTFVLQGQPGQSGKPFVVKDGTDEIVAYVDISGNYSGNNIIFGDGTIQTTSASYTANSGIQLVDSTFRMGGTGTIDQINLNTQMISSGIIRQGTERVSTGTGISLSLANNNHQTINTSGASAAVTVTLRPPSGSAAGTLIVRQFTPRNITWSATTGTVYWMGTKPTWSGDPTGAIRLVAWRWDNTNIYLAATDTGRL